VIGHLLITQLLLSGGSYLVGADLVGAGLAEEDLEDAGDGGGGDFFYFGDSEVAEVAFGGEVFLEGHA
jgi:hypothetical protein